MARTNIQLLAGGLLLLMAGGYVQAEALQPDPAWQQDKLANGFQWQVLTTPQRPGDRIELRLMVNTGSLAELPQQKGLSHFIPQLILSQMSQNNRTLWQQSQDPNRPLPPAVVSYNTTLFNISLPNNRNDLLKETLKSLASYSSDLTITPETLDAGLRFADAVSTSPVNPQDNVWRYRLKGSALLGNDPSNQPDVPVDSQNVKDFYNRWYTPDAMTLIVVGNVDGRSLAEQISKSFGALKGRREAPHPVPTLQPLSHEPVSLRSASLEQDRLSIIWETPWQPIRDSAALLKYWRADLAREALFWDLQQHLQKNSAKEMNLSFACRVLYQYGQCAIHLDSPADKLNANLSWMGHELQSVRDNGLSQEAFIQLTDQKKKELAQLFTTYARMDTGMLMNQRVYSQQNQVVDIAPEQYQKLRQDFLNSLTLDMMNQDLRQILSQDVVLMLQQPTDEPELSMKDIQDIWNKYMSPAQSPAEEGEGMKADDNQSETPVAQPPAS